MNCFNGIGRLTNDPDVRYSGDLCVASYTLAIDRPVKKGAEKATDFIRCGAFGKTGEFAEKYLRKGNRVGVMGRVQTGSYKDKDGRTVYTTDIIVSEHTFCESKPQNRPGNVEKGGFMDIPEGIEEELPFT